MGAASWGAVIVSPPPPFFPVAFRGYIMSIMVSCRTSIGVGISLCYYSRIPDCWSVFDSLRGGGGTDAKSNEKYA